MGYPGQIPDPESFEAYLGDVYAQLPVLVVRLTTDGMVLGVNPAVTEVTGYGPEELLGRNWWGMMFPGKLFAQVPKFISPTSLDGLLRDQPMALRCKNGKDKVVAWTRFTRAVGNERREVVCIGQDLTDRLTRADLPAMDGMLPEEAGSQVEVGGPTMSGGDEASNNFIMPLAISPPLCAGEDGTARAIQEVQEFLAQLEARAKALEEAFTEGEVKKVAALAELLEHGAQACGLLDVTIAAERVQGATAVGSLEAVGKQVETLVGMCGK